MLNCCVNLHFKAGVTEWLRLQYDVIGAVQDFFLYLSPQSLLDEALLELLCRVCISDNQNIVSLAF